MSIGFNNQIPGREISVDWLVIEAQIISGQEANEAEEVWMRI